MTCPLHVHIAFHPASTEARALAATLRAELDDDPALPGLHIPTSITPEDGTGLPPTDFDPWALGERVLVVTLADDHLAADPLTPLPEGRITWSTWTADLVQAGTAARRCVPMQLSAAAWPLDTRLERRNFPRAFAEPEADRPAWVARRVVLELLRFLAALPHDPTATVAPTNLFLSHAKADIGAEGSVFNALKQHLTVDEPVTAWVDSGRIAGGADFGDAIAAGIQDATVVALRTVSYASRFWCREEILLAKERGRPLVVVEALAGHEVRSFPYLGNAPAMSWSADPAAVVALALKETLRHRHAALLLGRQQEEGDVVLAVAPEWLTVAHLAQDAKVLYPDPALGDDERERIEQRARTPATHRTLETPWLRLARRAPLAGMHVALSASPSNDPERYGQTTDHLAAAAVRISHALILAGATLHYGGYLGDTSYTERLFEFVRRHSVSGVSPPSRIVNHVGWPLPLPLSVLATYRDVARFHPHARPADVSEDLHPDLVATFTDFPPLPLDSAAHRYAWARGMTEMRKAQTQEVHARVVIGGPVAATSTRNADGTPATNWYKSRMPGVVGEVLCSLAARQPVFLLGGWGGAARLVADEALGHDRDELSWDVQRHAPFAQGMRQLYEEAGTWQDYASVRAALRAPGPDLFNGLGDRNGELFTSVDTDAVVALLLEGLSAPAST